MNDEEESGQLRGKGVVIGHGAVRGAIAAMSMTGMRTVTVNAGIVDQAPPQAIFRQRIHRLGVSSRQRGDERE